MKEYDTKRPLLVVGGGARAFLGEYMAGGLIIVLGLDQERAINERGIASGIHGGEIYIRGKVKETCLGVGAKIKSYGKEERELISPHIREFAEIFDINPTSLLNAKFTRIGPESSRPFANKYTWE